MSNPAVLKTFRNLAHMAPFTRNVDALFSDFFLSPMSLDSTASGQLPPDADPDDNFSPQESDVADGSNPTHASVRSRLAPGDQG